MLLPQLCWLLLLAVLLQPVPAQKFSALTFLRVDQDKDKDCSLDCAGSPQKPLCASDGRTFLSRCEFQRAKCKDPQLEIAYRGNCKDVSRCVAERKYTQEQARKEFQQVFIPECNDDGTYSQVQCHSYTGYCWCVTPNGRPISGTAVAHKTPRCPGSINEKLPQREGTGKTVSLQIFSVLNSDDAAAPALETQPQGDEEDIASRYPTLWTEQVKSRQNKTNKNSVSSCDQEHQPCSWRLGSLRMTTWTSEQARRAAPTSQCSATLHRVFWYQLLCPPPVNLEVALGPSARVETWTASNTSGNFLLLLVCKGSSAFHKLKEPIVQDGFLWGASGPELLYLAANRKPPNLPSLRMYFSLNAIETGKFWTISAVRRRNCQTSLWSSPGLQPGVPSDTLRSKMAPEGWDSILRVYVIHSELGHLPGFLQLTLHKPSVCHLPGPEEASTKDSTCLTRMDGRGGGWGAAMQHLDLTPLGTGALVPTANSIEPRRHLLPRALQPQQPGHLPSWIMRATGHGVCWGRTLQKWKTNHSPLFSVFFPCLPPAHRYEQPKCDNTARAHPAKARDLYKGRQLQGCPGAKKHEFLTSILDALSTDMVHAVSDPSSSSGRLSEPDPSHTLEERVVHWYFKLLDKNSSGDIGKKEIKPFKRFLRKKSKPKKCVKKFVEYCDVNNDKSISVQELMGCLGVAKEDGKADTKKRHTPRGNAESTSNRQPRKQG
ncbi:SPARC-related modular calcium-binding protein 2 [Papio anubis]|nr:SPARC-related modular calcium-binding protein 2 [Papio anubis]